LTSDGKDAHLTRSFPTLEENSTPVSITPKSERVSGFLAFVVLLTVACVLLYALLTMSGPPVNFSFSPAHKFRAKSIATINRERRRFFGRVRSLRPLCRSFRLVFLVKARGVLSDIIVRRKKTGPLGRWTTRLKQPPQGSYYARVIARGQPSYLHFHRCRGDRSRLLRVRGPR
jgi:hypothetical protein